LLNEDFIVCIDCQILLGCFKEKIGKGIQGTWKRSKTHTKLSLENMIGTGRYDMGDVGNDWRMILQ
jgi:hypothetical protein